MYAVGATPALVLHWDGASWSVSLDASFSPHAVWASAADDVWVAGLAGWCSHWDGSAWSDVNTAVGHTSRYLIDLWGSGPDDIWAVGGAPSCTAARRSDRPQRRVARRSCGCWRVMVVRSTAWKTRPTC